MPTPPRIGMVSGEASFWRPGAKDWAPAEVNTPLAEGDALYTDAGATLEVQIGPRAYLRMSQRAMLTLLGNDPDLEQFKITSGIVAFDLRSVPAGHSVEVDTPSAAFNIDSPGYYRVEITDSGAHFIVRRGGQATVTLPDGSRRRIAPSQEAVIDGGDPNNVETYVAPEVDAWDEWNYARTDSLIDAISNRYVPQEVYGADDLDHYGDWRVMPDYGPVWVPSGVASGWAPYSTGSWVWDPVYAWTWVDTAPWGWAPYHYGRWVYINGFWAWAPGPRVAYPTYAPALVAFFYSGSRSSAYVSFGGPGVSWVALGWGEPCLPWWGRTGFAGRPWWGGWGGPRVINNVVIQHNTVINNVTNITYRNAGYRNALIGMPERNFGHGRIAEATRLEPAHVKEFTPVVGKHPVRPSATSLTPTLTRSIVPAQNIVSRPAVVVRTRPQRALPWGANGEKKPELRQEAPQSKDITAPPQKRQTAPWARFGNGAGPERSEPRRSPEPPRIERWSAPAGGTAGAERRRETPEPVLQEPPRPAPQQRQMETGRPMNAPQAERPRPMPEPVLSEPAHPTTPQRQAEPPVRVPMDAPQLERRRQMPEPVRREPMRPAPPQRPAEPAPSMNLPQAEAPREAPRPIVPQQTRPALPPRQMEAPGRVMGAPQAERRESPPAMMRRESPVMQRQEQPPANFRSPAASPLPGRPANQLNPRRFQKEEPQR